MRKIRAVVILFMWLFFPAAQGAIYSIPSNGNDLVGKLSMAQVESGDTVNTIRQRYEISYNVLIDANPQINFRKFSVGQEILIPSEYVLPRYRNGIVINTAELRLYYFTRDGHHVLTYPVAVGRQNWRTPSIITKIVDKKPNPTWYVPESIRGYMLEKTGRLLPDFIPPGPDNPLGKYALYLAKHGYLIHGTNQPDSVGTYASSGCIRMASDAIETLFNAVPIGTPVYLINHANKAGWKGDILYLESHEPISHREKPSELNTFSPKDAIIEAASKHPAEVDWNIIRKVADQHTGIPTPIGKEAL